MEERGGFPRVTRWDEIKDKGFYPLSVNGILRANVKDVGFTLYKEVSSQSYV